MNWILKSMATLSRGRLDKSVAKVGLYIENSNISDVDLSHPEFGNPGIGGTEFNFVSLPYYFNRNAQGRTDFAVYAQSAKNFPRHFTVVQVSDCLEALKHCVRDGCDILLWRPTGREDTSYLLDFVDDYNIKVIAWVHNTLSQDILNRLADLKNIKRFVAVSEEQLDILRDHPIIYKSCVIFNGLDIEPYKVSSAVSKDPNMVVYMGSLIPAKGFSMLAKVWKQILQKHERAELYVIGTGGLYDRTRQMGKWGVADEEFEASSIRPYLSDDEGNVHPSVHFLGVLGKGKREYLQKACVGVVNPTALTENCPGSALEFQAAGTPVVSGSDWGLLDTVIHGQTGLLGQTENELVENISFFLAHPDESLTYGENGRQFVEKKFNYGNICREWEQLFHDVVNDRKCQLKPVRQNFFYRRKWLRELVRQARYFLHDKTGEKDAGGGSQQSETDAVALNQIQQYLSSIHVKLLEYKGIDADDALEGSVSIQTLIDREKHLDAARRENLGLNEKNETLMSKITELKTVNREAREMNRNLQAVNKGVRENNTKLQAVNKGVREKNAKLHAKLADMEAELTACHELFRQVEVARRINLFRNPIRKFRSFMGLAGYGEGKNSN
jgi:glycosyltransferase involved in cell wall biosynthesis